MRAEVETDRAVPSTQSRATRYRPALDGLRAVAVYLVVAFHSGLSAFDSGFVGVDVFFVLSGYLVTQLLLRDMSTTGRVRFPRFYARRFRRILPAAAVTLIVTAAVYRIVATSLQAQDALGGFRASFLYVANWYFIRQSSDYFAPPIGASPVLHFWSLAVEEQFYLAWPLLLGGVCLLARRAGRHRWNIVRAVIATVCVLSAVEALLIARTNLARAYYGTDTRAYQLLLGALLALAPRWLEVHPRSRRFARSVAPWALIGVVLVATSALHVGPVTRGVVVALLATLLIYALEHADGGWAQQSLSTRRATYLGRISYGTYLWHWPVIVVATILYDISPVPLFAATCAIATGLAALSYRVMEHPIRSPNLLDGRRAQVIAGGLAISLVSGLLVMPLLLEPHDGSTLLGAGPGRSGATGAPKLLDWRKARLDIPPTPDCLGKNLEKCILVHGTGARVLIIGDSNARMWLPAFESIARTESLTFAAAVLPVCPPQRHLLYLSVPQEAVQACRRHQADWYDRVIPDYDPDVVVLAHQAFDDPAFSAVLGVGNARPAPGSAAAAALVDKATTETVAELRRAGRSVVLLEPIPVPRRGFDPLSCLSSAGRALERCTYRANTRPTAVEMGYRRLAQQPGVWSLDLDNLVCPDAPRCVPVLHDVIVKRDATHLTATFAALLAPQIRAKLDDARALEQRRG